MCYHSCLENSVLSAFWNRCSLCADEPVKSCVVKFSLFHCVYFFKVKFLLSKCLYCKIVLILVGQDFHMHMAHICDKWQKNPNKSVTNTDHVTSNFRANKCRLQTTLYSVCFYHIFEYSISFSCSFRHFGFQTLSWTFEDLHTKTKVLFIFFRELGKGHWSRQQLSSYILSVTSGLGKYRKTFFKKRTFQKWNHSGLYYTSPTQFMIVCSLCSWLVEAGDCVQ